jgi:hypothetical protein
VTAVIVIVVGLLLGLGLVASQLVRLKGWLAKSPPPSAAPEGDDDQPAE